MVQHTIFNTKIEPPKVNRNILARHRVKESLEKVIDYRLTVLQAGAGFGKSTALAIMAEEQSNIIWYNLSEEDQDPFVFLRHLCYATKKVFPNIAGLPIPALDSWDSPQHPLSSRELVFQYLNAIGAGVLSPALIILDDLHLIDGNPEIAHLLDNLIGLAPAVLHFVVSTRQNFQLPNLFRWRSLGQVQTIDQTILSFSEEEIAELFNHQYGIDLSDEEVGDLYQVTEGWAISLQLIGQQLNSGAINTVKSALSRPTSTMDSLFEILAKDVLERQPEEIRNFMRNVSVLRTMKSGVCNWLMVIEDGQEKLDYLHSNDLFVTELGEKEYRFHPIFQQFLHQQTDKNHLVEMHQCAAEYYQEHDQPNLAIFHFIQSKDFSSAAELLNSFGGKLHAVGHLDTLVKYLDYLPPDTLGQYPTLLFYLGDIARLHSRFEDALGWYQQAESLWRERNQIEGVSRALRGQARVYLDTVNPTKAEELLQEALRMSDGIRDRETRARLHHLLAENKLNLGNVEEAEKLRNQAELLRREGPDDAQLGFRVLLRTGRLSEARKQLENQALEENSEPYSLPRSHRETHLLLSIIYSMQGETMAAMDSASEAIRRGKKMGSPFITAVGYMRQGHAYSIQQNRQGFSKAGELFDYVIELSEELATPRLPVEALWGLVRMYGYQGNLECAHRLAQEGVCIATQVGDEWIASLIRLAMGASCVLAEDYQEAFDWLDNALRGFQECSDPFGRSAVRLWQCLAWFNLDEHEILIPRLFELFSTCQKKGYDYLFTRSTLLGLLDERLITPLLIWARENNYAEGYPQQLLSKNGLDHIKFHPGYQLRVKTLGGFQVWRGSKSITQADWHREKSRQLFQLLITYRTQPLDREQICEHLWPGADPDLARRNFKVALNNLYSVLEPGRKPGGESAFVLRERAVYGLRPGSDIWIDAERFEVIVDKARELGEVNIDQAIDLYEQALSIYQGEFLPDARYLIWPTIEREHLAVLYLQSAEKFCEFSLRKKKYQQVIEECQRILSFDTCWERAYRHLMIAYDGLGDHGQVARTYRRCVSALETELNVKPSDETISLFNQLTR